MKAKYKAIIYDVDGTILATLAMNMYPLMQIIKEELNQDMTFEEIMQYSPYPGMKVMELLGVENKEEVYARWVQYVNEYEAGAALYEGMHDVLVYFQNLCKQCVVSSKTKKQYAIDMVEKGLDVYMSCAILADDTKRHKPYPDPLLLCLEKLGIKAEEAIYIGDARSDYEAAKAANIDFGYAKWGNALKETIEGATYVFESPMDLLVLGSKD